VGLQRVKSAGEWKLHLTHNKRQRADVRFVFVSAAFLFLFRLQGMPSKRQQQQQQQQQQRAWAAEN